MAKLKTTQTDASVAKFLNAIKDESKRKDCKAILTMMKQITRAEPKMWGSSIVGFGIYHYKYESGHEGDCFLAGFSPRAQNITIYIMAGFSRNAALMKKLGKYKTGKSCLYINRLSDIDAGVLKQLIKDSVGYVRNVYKQRGGS